jgi:hypothetical protein
MFNPTHPTCTAHAVGTCAGGVVGAAASADAREAGVVGCDTGPRAS